MAFIRIGFTQETKIDKIDSLLILINQRNISEHQQAIIYSELSWEFRNNDFEKSLSYGNTALSIAKRINDPDLQAKVNNQIGVVYRNIGNYSQAMNSYFDALQIAESNEILLQIGYSYNNIGDLYKILGNHDLAIENIEKALASFTSANDLAGEAYALIRLSEVYEEMRNYAEALKAVERSLSIRLGFENSDVIASSLNTMGLIQIKLGKFENALESLEKSLILSEQTKNDKRIAEIHIRLGKVHLGLNNLEKATHHSNIGLNLSKKLAINEFIAEALGNLAIASEKSGDLEKSNQYLKDQSIVRDEMFLNYGSQQIHSLQNSFELLKRQQEQEREKAIKEWQSMAFIAGGIILLLLVIIIIILLMNQKRQNELNSMLATINDEVKQKNIELVEKAEVLQSYSTKLKGILDSTNDSNILISTDFKILNFNKVAEDAITSAFGTKPKVGDDFHTFIIPKFVPKFEENFKEALLGNTIKNEYKVDISEHNHYWFDFQFYPVFDDFNNVIAISLNVVSINDRKIAEQKLLESQKESQKINNLLSAILESPQGMVIFALDNAYKYMAFTKAHQLVMHEIWGCEIKLGDSILNFIRNKSDLEKAKHNFDRALGGESFVVEEEYGDEKLHRIFYEDRYNPLFDEDGNVIGLTVFVTDITDRRLGEMMLEDNEIRARNQKNAITKLMLSEREDDNAINGSFDVVLKTLTETLEVERASIWLFNEDKSFMESVLLYVRSLNKYSKEGKLIAKEFPNYFEALINEHTIIAHDTLNDPKTIEFKNNYLLPLNIGAMLDVGIKESGNILGVLCVEHVGNTRIWKSDEASFVTAMANYIGKLISNMRRMEAENALKESENYHKTLLKTLPDLMFVIDLEGNYLDYKPGAEDKKDIFDNPIGRNIRDILPKDAVIALKQAQQKALSTNEMVEFHYSLISEETRKFYNSRVMSLGGNRVMVLAMDVTDAITNLNRIETLLKVKEDQNKRFQNFAHIVSHNLRSHAANMQGLLEVIGIEEPELIENPYIKMIGSASNNLSETIDHLNLVLNTQEAEQEHWETLYLKEMVISTTNSISLLADKANVKIIVSIPEDLTINCVPAYLGSIILNMLTNAIKYKSDTRESYVKVLANRQKDKVEMIFEDNGLGIDLKRHEKSLFGMYKTFHTHKESKGLGLFITMNQVQAMGGEILVQSEVDKGTTFKVILPNG